MIKRIPEIIQVGFVSLILLILLLLSTDIMLPSHELYNGAWMHHEYLKSAQMMPQIYSLPPFCWRLFVPFLVYIIPTHAITGYLVVTLVSLFLSSLVMFSVTKHFFAEKVYSWIGLFVFYSFVYVVRINLIEFIAVDPLAFFMMLTSIYAICKNKNWLFIVAMIVGVAAKEILLFMIPLYFTLQIFNEKKADIKKLLLSTISVSLPVILVFLVVRIFIPAGETNYFDSLLSSAVLRLDLLVGNISSLNKADFLKNSQLLTSLVNIYRISLGALGPILLFIILKSKKNKMVLFKFLPLIVLSIGQLFIANDNERLVMAGFPAYLILFLFSVKEFVEKDKIDVKYFFYFAMVLYFSQMILTSNFYYQTYYSQVLQISLGAGLLIIIYLVKILKKKKVKSNE